ncbi:MAG TPA: hypothetical protein VH496_01530 [Mycobacterium sp.]
MKAVMPAPSDYLAEWYLSGLCAQAVDDAVAELRRALAIVEDAGPPVVLLAMFAAAQDEVLYGVFSAASPSAVIQACMRAGYPVDRLTVDVDARILVPETPETPAGCP